MANHILGGVGLEAGPPTKFGWALISGHFTEDPATAHELMHQYASSTMVAGHQTVVPL